MALHPLRVATSWPRLAKGGRQSGRASGLWGPSAWQLNQPRASGNAKHPVISVLGRKWMVRAHRQRQRSHVLPRPHETRGLSIQGTLPELASRHSGADEKLRRSSACRRQATAAVVGFGFRLFGGVVGFAFAHLLTLTDRAANPGRWAQKWDESSHGGGSTQG
jgi:hypothetical protein